MCYSEAMVKIKYFLRPLYRPVVDFFRIRQRHDQNKLSAEIFASSIKSLSTHSPKSTILVIFSDDDTPPLYGDFFTVLMLARFLSFLNFKVVFIICETNIKGTIWESLSKREKLEYKTQRKLAVKQFRPKSVEVIFTRKSKTVMLKLYVGKADLVIDHRGIEAISPYIIHILIDKYKINLPKKFLLPLVPTVRTRAYVTWAIRKSKWRKYSDSTIRNIKRDFVDLRRCFPDHNIMIVSNLDGMEYAYSHLFNTPVPKSIRVGNALVIPQKLDGFVGGIKCVLGSDFYFQRSGGGMLVAAAYSQIPYLYLQEAKNTFYGRKKRRSFVWSTDSQITIRSSKALTKILPISQLLKRIKLESNQL